MRDIAAIVVTYNRSALLKECIDALTKSVIKPDIIVVDNASTDGTGKMLETYAENGSIIYYNTGENIGGAGGFNFGMKKAYELGYEYFWLMDDDTIVTPDALGKLLDAEKLIGIKPGFLSSCALWTDGSICMMNRHVLMQGSDAGRDEIFCKDGIVRAERATFVSFLVRRYAVKELGFPVSQYFIWGDDTEYSMRISRKYPSFFVSDSLVLHKTRLNNDTLGIAGMSDRERIIRMKHSIRNDGCTERRRGIKYFLKYSLKYFKEFFRVMFSAKCSFRLLKLRIIAGGYIRGLFFNPRIEYAADKQ